MKDSGRRIADPHHRGPILALVTGLYLSAELVRQELHSVADSQNGLPRFENVVRYQRRVRCVNTGRSARENESLRFQGGYSCRRSVMRDQLAVHMVLANPPGDELAVLRAEVDHRHRVA